MYLISIPIVVSITHFVITVSLHNITKRTRGQSLAMECQSEGLTPAINREEVEVALKGMKHRKAMGPDGIPVEVWKSLGEEGVDMLLDLLHKIFEQEKMPEEWRDSVIVPIFKGKGTSMIVGITEASR